MFRRAADTGSLAAVEVLLSTAGIESTLNAKGFLGATAVSRAARRGHDDCLAALLARGADAGIPNDKLQYPMHFAAFKLKPGAVAVLLVRKRTSCAVLYQNRIFAKTGSGHTYQTLVVKTRGFCRSTGRARLSWIAKVPTPANISV